MNATRVCCGSHIVWLKGVLMASLLERHPLLSGVRVLARAFGVADGAKREQAKRAYKGADEPARELIDVYKEFLDYERQRAASKDQQERPVD